MNKIPAWLLAREGLTARQWKSRKRKELAALTEALETYRFGCTYISGEREGWGTVEDIVTEIDFALDWLKKQQSIKNWGR